VARLRHPLSSILAAACLLACHHAPPTSSCALSDGRVLDASGRADGFYGVVGERVGESPLARFEHMTKLSEGVDARSGKRWIRFRLADEEALAAREFTASPQGKSVAVVIAGEVACQHKLRTQVQGPEVQVSCCNPLACDQWNELLPGAR
jgi:hypothetical protein